MLIQHVTQLMEMHCRATEKWGLYVSWNPEADPAEVLKACPLLKDVPTILDCDYSAVFILKNSEEAWTAYKTVVGDDGPTESNPYTGPAVVYAYLCDSNGNGITENT